MGDLVMQLGNVPPCRLSTRTVNVTKRPSVSMSPGLPKLAPETLVGTKTRIRDGNREDSRAPMQKYFSTHGSSPRARAIDSGKWRSNKRGSAIQPGCAQRTVLLRIGWNAFGRLNDLSSRGHEIVQTGTGDDDR